MTQSPRDPSRSNTASTARLGASHGLTLAHAALPASGRGPGVLVLSDGAIERRDGDLLADACRRLTRHGFVALAPRLPEVDADALHDTERRVVDAGIEQLFNEDATEGSRVGVIGFGRGGWLALEAAARGARVGLVVQAGGGSSGESETLPLATLEAPVFSVFGEKDPLVEAGRASEWLRRMRDEGIASELRVQPGAEAVFFDPVLADRFDAVAAQGFWDAALARLRAEL
ncbi:MAG: dienelactone hydrolase family protein [Myxococcota bacterium]